MQHGNLDNWRRFERHQASLVRVPTFSVSVDCFGEISNDCKSISCWSEIEDTLHQPNYGRGTIVLKNTGGKYSEAGRSLIDYSDMVKIWAGFNDDNVPIWKGIVTDAKMNSLSGEMNLSLAQFGELLAKSSTSGDFSGYNTPKTLIDHLCTEVGLSAPVYQNETGQPSTYTFANTYMETNPSYWAMVHGACFCIFYVPYFDVDGVLNLRRRSDFTDVDFRFDDSNMNSIRYDKDAELINNKIVDYANPVRFEFAFGDDVTFGQQSRSDSNSYSKSQWGEHSDYETDPFVGTWTAAGKIIAEVLDWYPYRRLLYKVTAKAIPHLELLDRVHMKSNKYNIDGKFTIIGRKHNIRPGYYVTEDTLMSAGQRF